MSDVPAWKLEEMNRQREMFAQGAYQDANGVWRWKSNNNVPFDDMLEVNGISPEVRALCKAARNADTQAFLTGYRQRQAERTPEQIAEQRAEERAAFGPGHSLVNVLTGERYTT